MKTDRLSKILSRAGVASRRACEELIFEGKVRVNGEKVLIPQTPVNLSKDKIFCEGRQIIEIEQKVSFMLNKPRGYICSNKRVGEKKLVIDLFSDIPQRLFSVGRLDRDTTGLIIVTNDGTLANCIIHPRFNVTKEYLLKTFQEITHEHLVCLSKGMRIEDAFVKPIKVTKVRKGSVKIAIKEGKKHEIRLLAKHAGLELLFLKRIRIGDLKLGTLPEGSYRELTPKELQMLLQK